jgi:hypothetical protein
MAEPEGPSTVGPDPRQPYEKPAVTWDEPLEDRPNLIAACAQRPGMSDECNASPTS